MSKEISQNTPDLFTGLVENSDPRYTAKARSNATAIDFTDTISLTKQSFAEECDINTIMARFSETGVLPEYNLAPRFGDVSLATDYQQSLQIVMEAEEAFEALPAKIRARFDNDPEQLLAFIGDYRNKDEAQALGLLNPAPEAVKNPSAPTPSASALAQPSTPPVPNTTTSTPQG